jgi:2'-5' RNA ligase
MHGIVSILNEPHHEKVLQLWQQMRQRFGVGRPEATAVPHFSYHIAPTYDLVAVKQILQETAVFTHPFTVKTEGLGIFTGEKPVIYIPITRNPALTALHQHLWPLLQAAAQDALKYYAPNNWFPHITLGHGDITAANLGDIVTWLNGQSLAWNLKVDNLDMLHDDGNRHIPLHQVKLQI